MDFDNIVDERRLPRFQLQSGGKMRDEEDDENDEEEGKMRRWEAGLSVVAGVLLLSLAMAAATPGTTHHLLLLWIALSMLIGPFAPLSVTGGDCRVGRGDSLPPFQLSSNNQKNLPSSSSSSSVRISESKKHGAATKDDKSSVELPISKWPEGVAGAGDGSGGSSVDFGDVDASDAVQLEKDEEWAVEEIELLRKQMAKFPRGTLQRWHVIAEAFGGSRSVESITTMAKALTDRKPEQEVSSYDKFLALRKRSDQIITSPLSRRDEECDGAEHGATKKPTDYKASSLSNGGSLQQSNEKMKNQWTNTEDQALLSALKAYSKDTPMRWEKVAVALPGRSKGQCLKRFSELRENFRNMKTVSNSTAATWGQQLQS